MSTKPIPKFDEHASWGKRLVPAIDWLAYYERENLPGDVLAGVIVAALLIPQGMAYALSRHQGHPLPVEPSSGCRPQGDIRTRQSVYPCDKVHKISVEESATVLPDFCRDWQGEERLHLAR